MENNLAELKEEYHIEFYVDDRCEMLGRAVNRKLSDIFEWFESILNNYVPKSEYDSLQGKLIWRID